MELKYNYIKEDIAIGSTIRSITSDELYTILDIDEKMVRITALSDNDINKTARMGTTHFLFMINTERWIYNKPIENSVKKDRLNKILKNL